MDTGFSLDWLSFTVKGITDIQVCNALSFGQPYEAWTPVKGLHGYKLAKQHPFGQIVMSNPDRRDMGVHAMMTGRAMAKLTEGAYDTLNLLPWVLKEGGRISRLDLAIDLHDTPVDIPGLSRCQQVKGAEGSALKWNLLTGSDGGATLYIGSRKSEKFMRVYNKAAQMGLPGVEWTRFELEVKAETSRTIAAALSALKRDDVPAYVKGLMRALFNPIDETYQKVMDAPAVQVPSTKNASDNTIEWLLNSVAKTMANQQRLHHDIDVIGLFMDSVAANMQQLGMSAPGGDDPEPEPIIE